MFSIAVPLESVVRLMRFEASREVLILTRIKRRDKGEHVLQHIEITRIVYTFPQELAASYTDRKEKIRILSGSVYL